MGKKSTVAVSSQRTMAIYDMLLSGMASNSIIRFASDKWQIGSRQVENYIQKANDIIRQEAENIQADMFGKQLLYREQLRQRALENGDDKFALEVVKDMSKLCGLYPAERTQNQNLNVDLTQLSNEQLEKIIDGENVVTAIASGGDT